MNSLPDGYRAVVFGDTGALGQALYRALRSDSRCASVKTFSRSGAPPLVLEDPESLQRCAQSIADDGPFHLIIDATGALIIDNIGPEKRLDDLDAKQLQRAMQVNAIGPAMLLRFFLPCLPRVSERSGPSSPRVLAASKTTAKADGMATAPRKRR